MKKQKTVYVCSDCGADHAKWQGQCQSCGAWNTLTQLSVAAGAAVTQRGGYSGQLAPLQTLGSVPTIDNERWRTESGELNRVLGGGLVPGSAILMGGAPGAGKSTLLLQVVSGLAERKRCLYITGEESLAQVALRAKRLKLPVDAVSVAAQTSLEAVFEYWDDYKPDVLVVDSIQVMHSESLETLPGSVSQVREVAARLVQRAKQSGTVLILVGHVTKEGNIAGPRVLEHMIDTFLMLGGEDHGRFRMLRSVKNRFGAVNELGIFAMMETGMLDVDNPSAIFLSRGESSAPGSQVMAIWEEPVRCWWKPKHSWMNPCNPIQDGSLLDLKVSDWRCCLRFCIAMVVCSLGTKTFISTPWVACESRKPVLTWRCCLLSFLALKTGHFPQTLSALVR